MRGRGLLSVSVSEQLFVSPAEKEKEKAAEVVVPQGKDERTRTTIYLCFRTAVCESSREGGEGEGCGGRGSPGQAEGGEDL